MTRKRKHDHDHTTDRPPIVVELHVDPAQEDALDEVIDRWLMELVAADAAKDPT